MNRGVEAEYSLTSLNLSPNPTVTEISRARVFSEPLVPIGSSPTPDQNTALATALVGYSNRSGPDDFSSLTDYLERYPDSPWNASLLTNLGTEYYNTGHFSKTFSGWNQAWQLAKAATDPNGKAVADRAVSELAQMYARLGRMSDLEALLEAIEGRVFMGGATESIVGAKEGLINMKTRPEISFRCGPLAVLSIERLIHPDTPSSDAAFTLESTQNGCSLTQVADLSVRMGLDFQMTYRESGVNFVVPSIVHLKVGHYTALAKQIDDRYLLKDPTFGADVWVTEKTLEEESSGYCLIPSKELPTGWRQIDRHEGETIWGKGNTKDSDRDRTSCGDSATGGDKCKDKKPDCKGLAVPRVHLMLVSLNINDEPVGYTHPFIHKCL